MDKLIVFLENCLDSVLERHARYSMVGDNSGLEMSSSTLKNDVMNLHKGGMAKKDIAGMMKVSRSTVFKICKRCTRCSKEEKVQGIRRIRREYKKQAGRIIERSRNRKASAIR